MAVELIAKIKPKNNGDFKLVDTLDIDHRGVALDEYLDRIDTGGSGGLTKKEVQEMIDSSLSWEEVI